MKKPSDKAKKIPTFAGWLVGGAAAVLAAGCLWYAWRVFYYLDIRPASTLPLLVALCGGAVALVACAWLVAVRLHTTAARGAMCILLCGILFAFANPPLQTPDEGNYYLRSYSISQGKLDFDYARTYPEDVTRLFEAFNAPWVAAHTSQGLTVDSEGNEVTYNTAGYALKQYGEDGPVLSVRDGFDQYLNQPAKGEIHEPLCFMILPFVPQALGMLLARLLGLGALGCLYAGRLANLLAYAALGYATLKNCGRFAPVFAAVLLLPLTLFMGASLSYDATLLGCYFFLLSFLAKDTFTTRDAAAFVAALVWVNLAKPYINLLWAVIPLLIAAKQYRAKAKPWQVAAAGVAGSLAITAFINWYGVAFRANYPEYGRMLGEDVSQLPQLRFILANPLRFAAVLWGTLYENEFFVGRLGVFGNLDLPIAVLNVTGPALLILAAVLAVPKGEQRLSRKPVLGLGALSLLYTAGCMTAMYITYTPVGMVRVIGLQARYFLPVFLMLTLLLSQGLGQLVQPAAAKSRSGPAVALCAGYAVLGALLLFQHYFIGPVYTIQ